MIYTQQRVSVKWMEMVGTILVIGLVDYLFRLSLTEWTIEPRVSDWVIDPLVFYILLFSLRYGLFGAAVSFTLTCFYHATFLLVAGRDLLLYVTDTNGFDWLVLHFFVALSAGVFSTSYHERHQSLYIRQDELIDENEQLKNTLYQLRESQGEMRKKVLDSTNALSKIYDIGLYLDQDVEEMVRDHLIQTVEDVFHARQLAIYHVDSSGRSLRLHVRSGDAEKLPQSRFIDADDHVFHRMFQSRRPTMRTADELDGPLLVAPICYGGEVKEVLIVEEIDLIHLRDHEMNMLQLTLDWAGTRLKKAMEYEWLMVGDQLVEGTHLFHIDAFEQKVDHHAKRYAAYGQPYSTLMMPVDELDLSLTEMEWIVRQATRETDVIGYDENNKALHLLLPGTPDEHVDSIEQRIRQKFLVKGGKQP